MKRILVIEDNLEVRENLCEILELSGYEVSSAENGKLGVTKAHEVMPHLIICDVMMPELDGFGVLKIINKTPALNHIPLIFLTAKAEKSDFRKGMGLGAEDYITKPFDDVELLEAIEMRLVKAERIQNTFEEQSDEGLQSFFSEAKAQKELEKLSEDKEVRSFNKKDIIYEEGKTARWLYFVVEGQIKEYKINEYGKELTTNLINPGEFFGYFPLINETKYNNNTACTTNTVLRLIPKEDFFILLFNNRDFAAKFIKMIANKAEDIEMKLLDIAYSSVRKKVANALCAFATKTTTNVNNQIELNVSRDDLAHMAGTAKETLIRTLSDFKQEGLISMDGKSILISDVEDLENLIA